MSWNEDLPDGDQSIAVGDDAIRANNEALRVALELEHDFPATPGNPTGRHHFGAVLDTTALVAVTNGIQDGSIQFITDPRPTWCLYYSDTGTWYPLDVDQPTIPRTDEQNVYTETQWAFWAIAGPSAGALAIDLSLGSSFAYSINGSVTISAPTNELAVPRLTSFYIELTDTVGSSAVAWDPTAYVSPNGVSPAYSDAVGAINLFSVTRTSTGKYMVVSARDVKAF